MLKKIAQKLNTSSLINERGGNFAMMTALLLPLSIGAAGVAIDLTSAMQAKNNLQNLVDGAALAGASQMSNKNLTEEAGNAYTKEFYGASATQEFGADMEARNKAAGSNANVKDQLLVGSAFQGKKIVAADTGDVSYSMTVTSKYTLNLSPLIAMFGLKSIDLTATGVAEASSASKNALSMYLVLDRSGSMAWDTNTVNKDKPVKTVNYDCSYWSKGYYYYRTCQRQETNYILKIEALKTAATSLLSTISKADPNKKYARVGAVSYNISMDSAQSLQWGTAKAQSYVDDLDAEGGTSSTKAFEKAYTSLNDASENTAHTNMNGKTPSKYIVFMTDGDNNYSSDDTNTLTHCTAAKNAKMEVYTVAFMAPTRGQNLLKKCSTNEDTHYFAAESAEELVAAFKAIGEKASQTSTRLTN